MAYISQEEKKEKRPAIMAICKKYGVKASVGIGNHSTLVVNVSSGSIDFLTDYNKSRKEYHERSGYKNEFKPDNYIQVNEYHIESTYKGKTKRFLLELRCAMNKGNHDNSDLMTDYFDVGFYISINIGKYDKPYILTNN